MGTAARGRLCTLGWGCGTRLRHSAVRDYGSETGIRTRPGRDEIRRSLSPQFGQGGEERAKRAESWRRCCCQWNCGRGESAIQAVRSCPVRSCGVVRACESSVWAGRDVRSVSCGSRQEWVGAPGRQGAMSGEGGDHDHGIYVTLLTTMACQWPAPCLETLWRAARQRVFDGPASQPSHGQPGGTPRRQPSCSQGGHEARLARPALEQAWPAWPMIELR